jgi:hypothetical protein
MRTPLAKLVIKTRFVSPIAIFQNDVETNNPQRLISGNMDYLLLANWIKKVCNLSHVSIQVFWAKIVFNLRSKKAKFVVATE